MTLELSFDNLRELDPVLAADLAAFASPIASAGLADRALAGTARVRSTPAILRPFIGNWKHTAAIGAVACLVLVIVAGVMLPSLGARASHRYGAVAAPASEPVDAGFMARLGSPFAADREDDRVVDKSVNQKPSIVDQSIARKVIRTANVEVRVSNVRDAYQSAAAFVREDLGEFVQETKLSGLDPFVSATVTLRVTADRLPVVLQSLRGLGDVTSESTGGEDVTDQMVDLDARLRNEQRIEQELLTLLDTRKDAPLEDVLKVRESLGRIRENIERLTAQQSQLAKRVALSTITARLVAKSEPVAREKGWLDYMGDELGRAWRWSLRALADTISFLLAITVGGLIWWIILGAIIFAVRRWWRRRQRRLAIEPPPVI